MSKTRVTAPSLDGSGLRWLIAALALTLLPHLPHLPWWLGMLFVLTAIWRWFDIALPPRWLLPMFTLFAVGAILYTYQTLLGRNAGVTLLSAMVCLKFLELRTLRDGVVMIFLGYLLVMANLLYSQSLLMAGYLLSILVVLLAAQVMAHRQHSALPMLELLRLTDRILIQSIPFMLIMFILFPRIPGPLWGLPKDAHAGLTGLSDQMSPGTISELSQSGAVAFRVRFTDTAPPPEQLYWRGPVLWNYNGRTWSRGFEEPLLDTFNHTPEGPAVNYAVILEPHGKGWLFALDLPGSLPADTRITPSHQLFSKRRVNEVLRYEMRSYTQYRTGPPSAWERHRALRLPPELNPDARALAARWQKQNPRPEAIVRAALTLFREQPFYYTLTPPMLERQDNVDQFLFDTRQGFCEHYAGSFVFLMRAAGIPARVVIGYQGGERNMLGDYFIVRQSDAHAWAEVWLESQGWMRIDPTAAVAPERVQEGIYAALTDPETLPLLARRDNPWIRQLALSWDSLNNSWNEWVLAYGPERQKEVLSNLGFGSVDWRGMIIGMMVALGCIGLVFIGLHSLRRRAVGDPIARAYQRFCTKLARRGLERQAHEGPLDFVERVANQRPELAARVRLIGRLYANLRFGRLHRPEAVRQLGRLVREFKA